MAEVLPTHTPELFRTALRRAVELLRAGEVVALPTETVYGLACDRAMLVGLRRSRNGIAMRRRRVVKQHVRFPPRLSRCELRSFLAEHLRAGSRNVGIWLG